MGCVRSGLVLFELTALPYRNEALGRESTPEEVAGLADGSIRSF